MELPIWIFLFFTRNLYRMLASALHHLFHDLFLSLQNLLDLLPSRFTMQDAIGVRRQSGKDDKANEMLRSWIKRSYIFKDVTGEFVKTENYMKRHSQITPSAQTGAVGAVGQ